MARESFRKSVSTPRIHIIALIMIGLQASETVCGLPAAASLGAKQLLRLKAIEETNKQTIDVRDIFRGAKCGVPTIVRGEQVLNKRIVGGVASIHGEWPWMATLQLMNKSTGIYEHLCGGTLIHPQWVISVAHCFEKMWASHLTKNPAEWMVRLGEHHLFDDGEQHVDARVAKIILHPQRQAQEVWNHDIALLKLEKPVYMSRFVNLACVPLDEQGFEVGQKCMTSGWGHTSEGGHISPILRHVSVPIIKPADCLAAYKAVAEEYDMTMSKDVLCAGALGKGGRDACQYDSGGPMLCQKNGRFYVYGLVSTGMGCARQDYPGVYTRVTKYIPWITETISME